MKFKKKELRTRHVRMFPDTLKLQKALRRDVSSKQGKDVTLAELNRRIMNLPHLKPVLLRDAELKRKLKK